MPGMDVAVVLGRMNGAERVEAGDDDRSRAIRIYARSVFQALRTQGYAPAEIVRFATEVLALLTATLRLRAWRADQGAALRREPPPRIRRDARREQLAIAARVDRKA